VDQFPGKFSRETLLQPTGILFVRTAFAVCEKGKHGPDKVEHTIAQLKALFLKDLSAIAGTSITYPGWGVDSTAIIATPAASSVANVVHSGAVSLDDHSNPLIRAEKMGFKIGGTVYKKSVGANPRTLSKIISIAEDEIVIKQCCNFTADNLNIVTVSMAKLFEEWTKSNTEPPVPIVGSQTRPPLLEVDKHRCVMYNIVFDVDVQCNTPELQFYRNPSTIYTIKKAKANSITFVPMVPFANFASKIGASGLPWNHILRKEYKAG
jgi:hypothetical protein